MKKLFILIVCVLALASTCWPANARAGVRFYEDALRMDHSTPVEVVGPTTRGSRKEAEPAPGDKTNNDVPRKTEISEKASVSSDVRNVSPWVHDPDAPPGYTPPEVVKRLFSNPTRENAEAYVDWLIEENKKARKAVRLVQQVTKERLARREKEKIRKLMSLPSGAKPLVVAFLSASCPHCREQALILDSLNRRGPWKGRVSIKAYLNAANPREARDFIKTVAPSTYFFTPDGGRSRRLKVTTWPTLFVFPPGQTRKAARLKGMVDHRGLVEVLNRLAGKRGKGERSGVSP